METPQAKIVWSDNGKGNYDTRLKYRAVKDADGLYSIFNETGSVQHGNVVLRTTWATYPFATGIHYDLICDVIDEYERGVWCDICKCDGIIEDAEGYTHVCRECNN